MQKPHYTIDRFLNVRSATCPNFSPNGDRLVFLSDVTGTPQVWQVGIDLDTHQVLWPDQLTTGSERIFGAWFCPSDEDRLVFGRDTGGNENMQLYQLSLRDGMESVLTEGYEQVMHAFGGWLPDGRSFLFSANRRNPGLFDLYRQPLDGPAQLVWTNPLPGFLTNLSLSPDGKRLVFVRMASNAQHDLIELDLETGRETLLSAEEMPARYEAAFFGATEGTLLIHTDLNADLLHVAVLDLQTHTCTPLLHAEHEIEAVRLSPDRRKLAYSLNVDGASQIFLLDLDSGKSRRVPLFDDQPGKLVEDYTSNSLTFSPDSRSLAFAYSASAHPMDIFLWQLEQDCIHPCTRSSTAAMDMQTLAVPALVHYPSFDTDPVTGEPRRIPAWLYRPAQADGRLPVVVVVHGGPEGQFCPNFQPVVQYLVHQGYAVLAPNVRGSAGYGKVYGHLDDVEKRMDSVADLAHAARWLKEQPGFDPERIAVYGGSYGGFMVLSSLTTYPELWAAGVDIVGISNFVTFLENTSAYRRAHRESEYGSLERDRAFLERISPSNHLEKIQAPLLVIHGTNDPRVPLGETLQLVEKLEERGVPVQSIIFDDEGHGLVKLKNKLAAYPAVAAFLDEHLKPEAGN